MPEACRYRCNVGEGSITYGGVAFSNGQFIPFVCVRGNGVELLETEDTVQVAAVVLAPCTSAIHAAIVQDQAVRAWFGLSRAVVNFSESEDSFEGVMVSL